MTLFCIELVRNIFHPKLNGVSLGMGYSPTNVGLQPNAGGATAPRMLSYEVQSGMGYSQEKKLIMMLVRDRLV